LLAVIEMRGCSTVVLAHHECLEGLDVSRSQLLFTTEDRPFAPDPRPPVVRLEHGELNVTFSRPSAVLLSVWPGE
jgi:hypothetical protein